MFDLQNLKQDFPIFKQGVNDQPLIKIKKYKIACLFQ